MAGRTQVQTAARLGLTLSTVRTHRSKALRRLGVSSMAQAWALMLREGWVRREQLLPSYSRGAYAPAEQQRWSRAWVPSPAQRLYLDAFDRLLRERSEEAAVNVSFFFAVLCRERRIGDRRRGGQDVDSMLLGMARALVRPIAVS